MRGSTLKRGKTWTCYWDGPPHPDGSRNQRSKGGFATRKSAQAFLTATIGAVQDGTFVEPSKVPLAAFMEREWLPAVAGTVRPLTARQYATVTRAHVAERAIGGIPLRALSPAHVTALLAELEEAGLGAATRRAVHAVVRRALADAVKWGKLARNPAAAVTPPRAPDTRASAWLPSELRRFLDAVDGDRLAALWRLGATTGARRGELLGLQWRSLDLDGARLRVERQLLPDLTFGAPKSRRGERTVALDPATVGALASHREAQLLERAVASEAYEDGDLVFCDEIGRPIPPSRLTAAFARHRKVAGIPTGTLHTLRHTAATLMLTSGVPVHVAAARLGDRAEQVLSTYSHLLPSSDAEAAERVAAALAAR